MRLTSLLLVAVLSLCAGLAGCASSPSIHTDHDTTVDFAGWHTWAWAPAGSGTAVGAVSVSLHDTRIRRSVEAALGEAGYRRVEAADADFLVTYSVQLTEKQDVTVWDDPVGRYHWRGGWHPTEVSVRHYTLGSLALDVVQRSSGNVVWRGWAEATVQKDVEPAERERRIDAAVRAILARFPPR